MSATRECSLDLDLRDGFEWRGQSSLRGRRGKGRRRGEEENHADLPAPFYNYVERKLTNTNFEYFNDIN